MRLTRRRIMKTFQSTRAVTIAVLLTTQAVFAQASGEQEHAALAQAVSAATVTLQVGLSASAKYGKPISAKFEIGFEELQLSVYVTDKGTFSEVLVERETGKMSIPALITDTEDLAAAKAQSDAMANAKRSLSEAVGRALAANTGYRGLSVIPALKDGRPVAEVSLVKGTEWKTVTEMLD